MTGLGNEAVALCGTYRMGDARGDELELRPDGIAVLAGQQAPWSVSGGVLIIGGDAMAFRQDGDTLWLQMGMMTVPCLRVPGSCGAIATASAPMHSDLGRGVPDAVVAGAAGVVGIWDTDAGSLVLRPDGTARVENQEVTYSADGNMLRFAKGAEWRGLPYRLDGDRLILGSGPSVTCTRAGIPGVWVGSESSLDPQFYLSRTLYLTLYPDGKLGFAKSESGASQTQVSNAMATFRSWRENGPAVQVAGSWQSDGLSIVVQFAGRPQPVSGQLDTGAMKMVLHGIGALPGNEGGPIHFVRQ